MRKKIIAGNWKMYKDLAQANEFFTYLVKNAPNTENEIIIAPSYTNLWHAYEITKEYPIEIAAQNMHQENEGAYTGEVSAAMLKSIGIQRVILGHSERREYFNETDSLLAQKVNTALANEMQIIFCIGEKLEERKSNNHFQVVKSQLENGLFHLLKESWNNIVIAYEPVWAIGTGETATPEQAQEMHQFIRNTIREKYDAYTSENVRILYGGSVKPDNALELFSKPDVDGGLVGGASLKASDFIQIINAAD